MAAIPPPLSSLQLTNALPLHAAAKPHLPLLLIAPLRRTVPVRAAPPRHHHHRPPPHHRRGAPPRLHHNDDEDGYPRKRGPPRTPTRHGAPPRLHHNDDEDDYPRKRGPPPTPTRHRRAPPTGRGPGGRATVAEMVRSPVALHQQEAGYGDYDEDEEEEYEYHDDDQEEEEEEEEEGRFAGRTRAAALPKPPAGFVLDDQGRCIAAASKRIVTVIDDTNNRPLECIIRRVFRSTQDHECMLLCPVDMPVQVLKSTNFSGWIAVDDDQLKQIIPSVSYALARVHMHLVESGFCYTARGGFCFPEDAIQEFHDSDDGSDGVPFEGVEICCFNLDGAHYMIYTPVDPLLFVAVKDKDGVLHIAEDDLMDDPSVVGAIDEETEFTALVEEEEALLESVLGER